MKIIKLADALRFVKNALKTPYHFYQMSEYKMIIITLEDKQGKRMSFTGTSMFNAVESAVNYVETEIKSGSIKDPRTQKDKKEEKKDEVKKTDTINEDKPK